MAERVLAVFAHPDDESFWCGGTLAQHSRQGDEVIVYALTDGVQSRTRGADAIGRRDDHFYEACGILGVAGEYRIRVHVFEDQRSDMVPQVQINGFLEAAVMTRKPARVYTHSPGDLNLDHRRVAEAVLVATRGICPVYGAEPEWPERRIAMSSKGRTLLNISDTIETKLQACAAYVDELREPPHPRSLDKIRERASEHVQRNREHDAAIWLWSYAEAFEVYP